jgi:hypothetical protein
MPPDSLRFLYPQLYRMIAIMAIADWSYCYKRVSENSSYHHIVVLLQIGGVIVHEQNGNRVHLVRAKVNAIKLGTIIILHSFGGPVYP